MPPARTGVADYSAAMAAALIAAGHQVRVGEPGSVDLYHIGNNPLHRPMYERALARPGVVILHDAVLHHFYLGYGGEEAYVAEFVHNYGEWHRGLARDLWQARARSGSDPAFFEYPMLRRVAEAARLVIVHNRAAAAMVRQHAPEARVEELPHLVEAPPPPDPHAVHELRASWRIPAGGFLFGIFGHLRESKRIHAAVQAISRISNAWLLVAGDFVSEDYGRAMEPLLAGHPRVVRAPYLDDAAFWHHAHAADACINLRYPAAGETSGIAMRLMSVGKPVIVSSGAETSAIPAAACLRVDTGPAETEMLAAYGAWLAGTPAAARRIGASARNYVGIEHEAAHVVSRLANLLRQVQK